MLEVNTNLQRRNRGIKSQIDFLSSLPHNFQILDQVNLVQFKSHTKLVSSLSFHPDDWVFSFDLLGEIQGKVFAKFLMNKRTRAILNTPHDKQNLLSGIESFLNKYLDLLDEKYSIMGEIGAFHDLGTNVVPSINMQLDSKEWIRFTARYIYMSTTVNIPIEFYFQFIKKGIHLV